MTHPVSTSNRLYGMMQHLMIGLAQDRSWPAPAPRNVVELQDALDACLQLAAVIDEATQAGRIPAHTGQHAASMLMLVRDYIQPLPQGLDDDEVTDLVTPDLEEMVAALRTARNGA